ncbi:MAG: ATP-dependent 6-phosphofructokinase [Rhodospirillaceae bacterium]|nr:ATP-dependent 6-phosphofructokinase [Rhodospirillaceae bacterium]
MTNGMRIGILTSGGDCAGLNAVLRAAVHRAARVGHTILGIKEGTAGLLTRPLQYEVLSPDQFDGSMIRAGGTILGTTNKGDPFAFPMPDGTTRDRSMEIIGGFRELGIEALIGIGGDGSFRILKKLCDLGGINLVGIPKTIDNDVSLTEVAIGFDTAVQVATEALDRLQPTAASHHRVMVLEVMGRDAGHIALNAGIAGGADVILVPEIPADLNKVADKIEQVRKGGRNFALVVVSEAVRDATGETIMKKFADGEIRLGGIGHFVGDQIAKLTGAETRVTVLGHVQRGSMPSWRDRMIAAAFGSHAVDLIEEGKFGHMVAWSNRQVIDVPIEDAIKNYHSVALDDTLVVTARELGICLGD